MAAVLKIVGASHIVDCRKKLMSKAAAGKTAAPPAESGSAGNPQSGRRAALLLAATTILPNLASKTALAEDKQDNGFWLTGPLPVPSITNKTIANSETGTRAFLKKGIYIAEIGTSGTAFRLKHYAFDLLALEDMLADQIQWNYFSKYLSLKATVMFYDFDYLISSASMEKDSLTNLAARLFDNVEKLDGAVKRRSEDQTRECYADTKAILQEVMVRMA